MRLRKIHIGTIVVLFVVLGFVVFHRRTTGGNTNDNGQALDTETLSLQHQPTVVSVSPTPQTNANGGKPQPASEIVLAVVACGMRVDETLNMLKSAIAFNVERRPLRFVVIAEDDLITSFQEKLEDWQALTKQMFRFEIRPLSFPESHRDEWRNLFKPCASQRLFLPVCD